MITLTAPTDINWHNLIAVAYDQAPLTISDHLLTQVEAGRRQFQALIDRGVPCYGVTTGLGQLVTHTLSAAEQADLPHNLLRGRAAAIGPPLPRPIVRAMMMIKLVNFLSGQDGVSVDLVRFLVDRLNDGFTPWVPKLGHGMAADAIAHTHAFQTFIGEGFVLGEDGQKQTAVSALYQRHIQPIQLRQKEGLALLNGIAATPAYALDAQRHLAHLLALATAVSAVSFAATAAPPDSIDPALKAVTPEPGTTAVLHTLAAYLADSEVPPAKLQTAVSYRIIPQVHGALADALTTLRRCIENCLQTFSDNPLMVTDDSPNGGRFLSVGLFHNQHLVNQADHVALALAHVGVLSVRRLHRLLNPANTGLSPQLAGRPGLDAGLVVAHKAALGLEARLRLLANPVSLLTGESSAGQEDYMSQAFPTLERLYEMADLCEMILAYELLGGLTALHWRGQRPGRGVAAIQSYFQPIIAPFTQDRPPGSEVELILHHFGLSDFRALTKLGSLSEM